MIRTDILEKNINYLRQTKAIHYILQYGELTIKNFAQICTGTQRITLQHDLKILTHSK